MKRSRRAADETSRIGQILFWLFPYEQDVLSSRRARISRGTQAPARKERLSQVLGVLSRTPSVPKGGQGLRLVIATLLLSSFLVDSNCAQVTNPNRGTELPYWMGFDTKSIADRVVDPDSGGSTRPACLAAIHEPVSRAGDKPSGIPLVQFKAAECEHQDGLQPAVISITARGNDANDAAATTDPSAVTDQLANDLTIRSSTAVAQPTGLVSEVPLCNSSSACDDHFSSVVEQVFTGKAHDKQVAQLDMGNSGGLNPVLQDFAYASAEIPQFSAPAPVPPDISRPRSRLP
ncbi:MAG TPA: hypothetical protein VL486_03805 [Verrucomicrobiae bacterium]|nr:hypothetical protein [Verrucomicrobiae bacterium]